MQSEVNAQKDSTLFVIWSSMGDCPEELWDLTIVEETLIARSRIYMKIYKLNGKTIINNGIAQSKCCGNVITFPQNSDKLIGILPNLLDGNTFRTVFIWSVSNKDK